MKILDADKLQELINAKFDFFKKELRESIDAQITVSDMNVIMEQLNYELEKSREHIQGCTEDTNSFRWYGGYASGLLTAINIIKKGLK